MIELSVAGNPSHLESLARTRVQDLDSLASSLRMHGGVAEAFGDLCSTLEQLGGDAAALAHASQDRFAYFESEYERIGRPRGIRDDVARRNLEEFRAFTRELHDRIFELYPLREKRVYTPPRHGRRKPRSPYRR